jgi:serine protease Do
MPRRRSYLLAGTLLAAGALSGFLLSHASLGQAQPKDEADPAAAQERIRLYDALAKEVSDLEGHSKVLKSAIALVSPTVVHIDAERPQAAGRPARYNGVVEEAGSGVIVELGGAFYVLTNRHVIKDHDLSEIAIKLYDNRQINPTKVWTDPETDIAVMSISSPHLLAARVGDSQRVEIGDFVLAMGSPFGLSHSVTFGIVGAKGRRSLSLGADPVPYQDFLQTDAAINPGNSGGPLINLRGELIGINTAIASNSGGNEGIGFSIPINMVMVVARQMIEHGSVVRAFMGVGLDKDFDAPAAAKLGLPRPYGALIKTLTPGAPAESAKLQVGDVILEFNGATIDDDDHLMNVVALTEVGKEVPLVIWRNRRETHVTVKVGNRSDYTPGPALAPPRKAHE